MLCREGPSLWHKQRGSTDHHLLFKYASPKHSSFSTSAFEPCNLCSQEGYRLYDFKRSVPSQKAHSEASDNDLIEVKPLFTVTAC